METTSRLVLVLILGALVSVSARAQDPVAIPPTPPLPDINLGAVRAGYSTTLVGGQLAAGPAFGLAYEYQTQHVGVQFIPLEFGRFSNNSGTDALSLRLLRFGGTYKVSPERNVSPYAGAALAISGYDLNIGEKGYSSAGLESALLGGVEVLRRQNLRFFAEAELLTPLYRLESDSGGDKVWPVTAGLRCGVAFQSKRTLLEVMEEWM